MFHCLSLFANTKLKLARFVFEFIFVCQEPSIFDFKKHDYEPIASDIRRTNPSNSSPAGHWHKSELSRQERQNATYAFVFPKERTH